jgi:hypothetical protein
MNCPRTLSHFYFIHYNTKGDTLLDPSEIFSEKKKIQKMIWAHNNQLGFFNHFFLTSVLCAHPIGQMFVYAV